jgi:hypothetical protein
MTVEVSTTITRDVISGVGPYPFSFRIFNETDLAVTACSATTPAVPTLLNLSDYTVTGVNELDGGAVTLTALAASTYSGYTIDIRSNTPNTQPTSIRNTGRFSPEIHETAFDNLSRQVQDLARKQDLSVRFPDNVLTGGEMSPIANWVSKYLAISAAGLLEPALLSATTMTQSTIGDLLNPQTAAETSTGAAPTNLAYTASPINVLRYGIVPNSTAARSSNTAKLQALVDPTKTGPIGQLIFPPIIGNDVYYFDGMIPFRPGVHIDGFGCTLNFAKTYAAADDHTGFIYAIRDFSMVNIHIVVQYNGSSGVHAGPAIKLGNRENQGTHFNFGTGEEDLPYIMGNILLRNFTITTNNPVNDGAILALGGVENVTIEDFGIDGGGACSYGILAEMGTWSDNGIPGNSGKWSSSHPAHWTIQRGRITNLDDSLAEGAGIGMIGMHSSVVRSVEVDGAYQAINYRPGEALFFLVGPKDEAGKKKGMQFYNIRGTNIVNTGAALVGAESSGGGYLSAEIAALATAQLRRAAQINLMNFVLDGFCFPDADIGVSVSGPSMLRNGEIRGFSSSGAVRVFPEAGAIDIFNVNIFDGAGSAFNLANTRTISGSLTTIHGRIAACKVGGCTGPGITCSDTDGLEITNCDLGYATALDDADNEATMTGGVNLGTTARHVRIVNNYVRPTGGFAYTTASGAGDRGNDIVSPRGDVTHTAGLFMLDGISRAVDSAIIQDTDVINTDNKYIGKKVHDTTNNRLMIANGSAATSVWSGGGTTVTPV